MSGSEKSEGGMETLVSEKRMKTEPASEARRGGMNEDREGKMVTREGLSEAINPREEGKRLLLNYY